APRRCVVSPNATPRLLPVTEMYPRWASPRPTRMCIGCENRPVMPCTWTTAMGFVRPPVGRCTAPSSRMPSSLSIQTISSFGVLEALPDGRGVRCHVCGGFFVFLGAHVRMAHRLTAAAYREQFGLNRGTPLAAESFRAAARTRAQERGAARGLRPPPHGPAADARRL